MGLFGRKQKKDLTFEGIPGTAIVRGEEDASFFNSDESFALTDIGIGSYKVRYTLDVTLADGRPPYTVTAKVKVPAKHGGATARGMKVPVYVDPDDPNRLEINWEQFEATGGDAEYQAEASEAQRTAVHAAMPEQNRNMMVTGWVSAAKSGALSAADFDQALKDAVQAGMLTAEEADGVRKSVAGGS